MRSGEPPDKGAPGNYASLFTKPRVLVMKALKATNPLYNDISIDESETMQQRLKSITTKLGRDALAIRRMVIMDIVCFLGSVLRKSLFPGNNHIRRM